MIFLTHQGIYEFVRSVVLPSFFSLILRDWPMTSLRSVYSSNSSMTSCLLTQPRSIDPVLSAQLTEIITEIAFASHHYSYSSNRPTVIYYLSVRCSTRSLSLTCSCPPKIKSFAFSLFPAALSQSSSLTRILWSFPLFFFSALSVRQYHA